MSRFGNVLLAGLLATATLLPAAQAAEPHKIGYITDLSGPFRDAYAPVLEGFQVYIKRLNDQGGIDGHPVEVLVRDDQLNASRSASLAIELITGEEVSSLWGLSLSSTLSAVYQVAARHEVPAIANFSGIETVLPPAAPFAYSIGHVFHVAGEVAGGFAADLAGDSGTVVCVSIEAAGGFAGCDHTEAAVRDRGLDADRVLFPPTTVEFGAIAQLIADKKPVAIVTHLGAVPAVGVLRALRNLGYEGPFLIGAHGVPEQLILQAIEASGFSANTYLFSRFAVRDSEGPEADEFRAAVAQYGISGELSNSHIMGWVLASVAEGALRECGFPCDGPALNAVLENTEIDPGALLGGTIRFTPENHYGPTAWRLYGYEADTKRFLPVGAWVEAPETLRF